MNLTPAQATHLRSLILADLDKGEESVDIDARFVKSLFGSDAELDRWAGCWGIEVERYILKGVNRLNQPIRWVGFRKPSPPPVLLDISDDKTL